MASTCADQVMTENSDLTVLTAQIKRPFKRRSLVGMSRIEQNQLTLLLLLASNGYELRKPTPTTVQFKTIFSQNHAEN